MFFHSARTTTALALLAVIACGGGDDDDNGDNGEDPLSTVPEWQWLEVPGADAVRALVATPRDGVFALAQRNRAAQLHIFDGSGMAEVGPELAIPAELLAGRDGDAMFASVRFSPGSDSRASVYAFTGEAWEEYVPGGFFAAELGNLNKLDVDAGGTLWGAATSGLLRSDGPGTQRTLVYNSPQFQFGETFPTVATPPSSGPILASSHAGTYLIEPSLSATLEPIEALHLHLVTDDEGYAIVEDPPTLLRYRGPGSWTEVSIEGLSPREVRLAGRPGTSGWMLERRDEGDRLWRLRDGGAERFDLPADTPPLRDLAVVTDDDLWLATDDGRILRWVSPADFAEVGRTPPGPPEPPTVRVIEPPVPPESWGAFDIAGAGSDRAVFAGPGQNYRLGPSGWTALGARSDRLLRGSSDGRVVARSSSNDWAVLEGDSFTPIPGSYFAVVSDGTGRLWAATSAGPGELVGPSFTYERDTEAPLTAGPILAADGGRGEVWFISQQVAIQRKADGSWERYPLGATAGMSDIAWANVDHVIIGGQNGNLFEIKSGEVISHSGVSRQQFGPVRAAGDRLFARARGDWWVFDGRRWRELEVPGFEDVTWGAIGRVRPRAVYMVGAQPSGETVTVEVTFP